MEILEESSISNNRVKHESLEKAMTSLAEKFAILRKLIHQTKLFITQHYDLIINEIDFETESILSNHLKVLNQDEADIIGSVLVYDDISEINKTREEMIKLIKKCEHECLANHNRENRSEAKAHKDDAMRFDNLKSTFSRIVKRYKKSLRLSKSSEKSLENLQKQLYYLDRRIEAEFSEKMKSVLMNRTAFYIKNKNEMENKILTIQEEVEVECHRNFDVEYYLNRKPHKEHPRALGHLIILEDLYLNENEIKLINIFFVRFVNNHLKDFGNEFLNKRNQPFYRLFKDLRSYLESQQIPTKLELKAKYFLIIEIIESFYRNPSKRIITFHLDSLIDHLNQLERFDVSYLGYFYGIESSFFDAFINLKQVDLSHCGIKRIKSNQFNKLVYLVDLDLSSNQIKSIDEMAFNGLSSLSKLNLSSNLIEKFIEKQFIGLKNLEQLRLFYNQIAEIESSAFDELTKLKKIYLSGNKIASITNKQFKCLKNLEELDLSFNQIADISLSSFFGLDSLKRLNLSRNELRVLVSNQFIHLISLEELILFNNKIHEIHRNAFKNCWKLRKLNLLGNQLDLLVQCQFESLSNLEELNLNRNRISSMDKRSFVGLKNLKKIFIDLNKLPKAFDKNAFDELNSLADLQIVFKSNSIEL